MTGNLVSFGTVEASLPQGPTLDINGIATALKVLKASERMDIKLVVLPDPSSDEPGYWADGAVARVVVMQNTATFCFKNDEASLLTVLHEVAHVLGGRQEGYDFALRLSELLWRFGKDIWTMDNVNDLVSSTTTEPVQLSGYKKFRRFAGPEGYIEEIGLSGDGASTGGSPVGTVAMAITDPNKTGSVDFGVEVTLTDATGNVVGSDSLTVAYVSPHISAAEDAPVAEAPVEQVSESEAPATDVPATDASVAEALVEGSSVSDAPIEASSARRKKGESF